MALRVCLLLPALLLALGCSTRGSPIDSDSVTRIRPGQSAREDVKRWFGEPTSIQYTGSGRLRWRYDYAHQTRRDTGSVTKIGRSIASIFGLRIFFPPVDVAYEETDRRRLDVLFDADGRVIDYSYEQEKVPTRRIY